MAIRIDIISGMFAASLAAYLVYGRDTNPNNVVGKSIAVLIEIKVIPLVELLRGSPSTWPVRIWSYIFVCRADYLKVTFCSLILWWIKFLNEFEVEGKHPYFIG